MADNINVGIRIAGDSSGFVKAARASQTELDKLNRGFRDNSKSAKQFGDTTRQIGSQLTLFRNIAAGVGLSLGFGQAISEIRGFEKEMSQVRAISGATAKDMELLTKRARELGATTSFSAAEAAQGMTLLAQAGLSADQSLAAIGETLSLAAAGGLSLAEAADVATNTLSQFGLSADQAGRVADVLAQSAASANTTVSQMGVAMRQVGPVANSLGLDLETTAAAISTLSNSGIKGEQAGTGLRAVLASLIDPSKEAAEVIDRLGVNVSDLSDPGAVFEQFQKAGLTAKDAVKIFGREAAAAGLILAGASDDVATLTEKLNNAEGAAARMAKEVQDNLDGDIKTLSSSISELILQTGDKGLTGALRSGTQALTAMVRAASGTTSFADLREELGLVLDITSLVAVAIGGRLVASLATAATGMGAATTAATVLRGALTLLGGPVGIAVTAAGTLAILATRESETEKQARLAGAAHDELKKALDLVNESTGEARQAAIDHAISLADQKMKALESAEAQLKLVEAQIKGVESLAAWEKLKGAGDVGPIKAEASALRAEVEKLQSGIDELRNSSSLLTVTVEGVSSEMSHLDDRAAAALKTLDKNTKATGENAGATGKAAAATDNFTDSLQSLREQLDPVERAEREFQENTALLNRALKEGKINLAEYNKFLGLTFEGYNDVAGGAEEVAKGIDKSTDAAVVFTKEADPFADAWNRSIEDVSRAISDGLVGGFKDAASTIKSIFSSLLSSLVNLSIRSKILIPMGLAPGPAMAGGFGGGGFNPGSLFGLSGGATTAGANPISPMAAGGLPGGGASSLPFSGNLGFLNNSSFVSNPFTSALGGFAGNLGANALFGGNRGAGAGIGGTLGSIAGSFLPIPIPGVGTAIGGFLGNAIGGLFGGNKKTRIQLAGSGEFQNDAFAQSAFGTIGFSEGGTQKFDASKQQDFLNSLAQLDNALASTLLPDQIDRISQSMQDFTSTRQRGDFDIGELARERLDEIFTAIGDEFASLAELNQPIERIVADFTTLRGAMDALEQAANPAEVIGPFEASLRQLEAVFSAGSDAAGRLGLSIDELQASFDSASTQLTGQFNRDIEQAILAIQDPLAAELSALDQRAQALRREAEVIGGNIGAVNTLIELEKGLIESRHAVADADRTAAKTQQDLLNTLNSARSDLVRLLGSEASELERTKNQFEGFARSLRDFRQGLLTGPLSPLGPEQQLAQARQQFESISSRARLGDMEAIGQLEGVSQTFLTASKDFFASNEDFVRDFERVQSILDSTETVAERQANIADRQLSALNNQIDILNEISGGVQSLEDAIRAFAAAEKAAMDAGALDPSKAVARSTFGNADAVRAQAEAILKPAERMASSDFIQSAFQKVLGRAAEASAVDFFSKKSEREAAQIIFGSSEAANIRGFASGGIASGLALVGEQGPELVRFRSPSRVHSNSETRQLVDNSEVVAELKESNKNQAAQIRVMQAGLQRLIVLSEQQSRELADMRASGRRKSAA